MSCNFLLKFNHCLGWVGVQDCLPIRLPSLQLLLLAPHSRWIPWRNLNFPPIISRQRRCHWEFNINPLISEDTFFCYSNLTLTDIIPTEPMFAVLSNFNFHQNSGKNGGLKKSMYFLKKNLMFWRNSEDITSSCMDTLTKFKFSAASDGIPEFIHLFC